MFSAIAQLYLAAVLSSGAADPCASAVWEARLATPAASGARLVVEGRVYRPDGTTPAAGVIMYVYHTGPGGEYGRDAWGGPLLRAWLRTDQQGRYRYETVRPGAYPGGRTPAHIHIQFWGGSVPPQYAADLYFDDDPLVPNAVRQASGRLGRFGHVVRLSRRNGALHAEQNFRLKADEDRLEESILHGIRRCK
jgi:protocatechuate 3,4-dioxygenase, beta subunit